MQEKVNALLRMAADAAASMNNELRIQLVKIPKQVSAAAHTAAFCKPVHRRSALKSAA